MQLLPILLVVAAWLIVRWLVRRRRAELSAALAKTNNQRQATPLVSDPESVTHDDLRRLSVDEMRAALQRLAMEVTRKGISPVEKARVKAIIKEFAAEDPLVARVAEIAQALAIANPGFVQSKSYVAFPQLSINDVRYGMYFAHELGLIVRIKHGNSYRIFHPDTVTRRS